MITELTQHDLEQECSNCGTTRRLPQNDLRLGAPTGEDPNILRMPPCDTCGAVEFLNRTWDSSGRDGVHHRHLVNRLFADMAERGQVRAEYADEYARERAEGSVPPDLARPLDAGPLRVNRGGTSRLDAGPE